MSTPAELYEEDFLLWTTEQAKLLREAAERGVNFPLDWENLAEEVESLGKSQRQELRNRLTTIIEHLLKLEHSDRAEPRDRWEDTVTRSRIAIAGLLEDNPSLRREVPTLLERAYASVARFPVDSLIRRGELDRSRRADILARPYTEEQVLGDWYPDEPSP